jgi:Avidin family
MKHENALALAPKRSPSKVSFSGGWRNELGSTMVLRVKGNNVSGRYTSRVSSKHKPISGPVVGFVNGSTISFVVKWPVPSITAWVGQLVRIRNRDVLETLWQLTSEVENPGDPTELWNSVNSGADVFKRTFLPAGKSRKRVKP